MNKPSKLTRLHEAKFNVEAHGSCNRIRGLGPGSGSGGAMCGGRRQRSQRQPRGEAFKPKLR